MRVLTRVALFAQYKYKVWMSARYVPGQLGVLVTSEVQLERAGSNGKTAEMVGTEMNLVSRVWHFLCGC